MNAQRIIAFALTVTAAAVFAYTSESWLYSVVLCAIALAGVPGRFILNMSRSARAVAMLVITLMFTLKWQFAPFDSAHIVGFSVYEIAHATGQCFIALMTFMLFMPPRDRMPPMVAMFGITVFICAGDVLVTREADRVFHFLILVYVALASVYLRLCNTSTDPSRPRASVGKYVVLGVILLAVVGGGVLGSTMVWKYQRELGLWIQQRYVFRQNSGPEFKTRSELRSISKMQLKDPDAVALRVFCNRQPPYLRARAYETFMRSTWTTKATNRNIPPTATPTGINLPGEGELFSLRENQPADPVIVNIWPSPEIESGVFTPLGTTAMRVPAERLLVDNYSDTVEAENLAGGVNYVAVAPYTKARDQLSEANRRMYLSVSRYKRSIAREIADSLFASCRTAAEKMAAVEMYFHDNYEYEIGIQVPKGADPLTYFLTERPKAHCEFFATGAAVLLRLGDVPARYVTGYVPAKRADQGDFWIARNKDVHAWVEAWDDQRQCWRIVEATPAGGVPIGTETGWLAGLLELLNHRMQELRVAIHLHGFMGLVYWLGARFAGLLDFLFFTGVGLTILAVLAAWVGWRAVRVVRRRLDRPKVDPALAAMQAILRHADRRLARHGLVRDKSETLRAFADRIRREAAEKPSVATSAEWYLRYAAIRYGPGEHAAKLADLQGAPQP